MLTLADRTVEYAVVCDNSAEWVEYRVEDQRLQRRILIAFWCWNTLYDSLQNLWHTLTGLTRCTKDVVVVATKQIDNLILHLVNHCRRHIDLIQDRDNLQVVTKCEIEVRDSLRLNTLRSIHNQQCTLARCDGTRHLVREVDMSWGVDKVEGVVLAIARHIVHLNGVRLDSNTLLALEIHVVKHLRLHLSLIQSVGSLQQTICQGRFTVVNMGYNAKISNVLHNRGKDNNFLPHCDTLYRFISVQKSPSQPFLLLRDALWCMLLLFSLSRRVVFCRHAEVQTKPSTPAHFLQICLRPTLSSRTPL